MTAVDPASPVGRVEAASPRRGPTAALAELLGVSHGQVSTLLVALAVAIVLTVGGLPPVLRHRSAASTASVPAATAPTAPARHAPATAPSGATAAPVLDPVADAPLVGGAAGVPAAGPGVVATAAGPVPPAVGTAAVFAPVGSPGSPEGIAVGADGTVFVATDNGPGTGDAGPSKILSYSSDGVPGASFTVTGQAPDHARGLTGLAVDGRGGLIALDAATARVLRIDLRSGRQSTFASLPDLPACQLVVAAVNGCEPGVHDDGPLPLGAAVDAAGEVFVTDSAQGVIWRIPAGGGTPVLFIADAAFGSGAGPSGVALGPDGSLLVVVPRPLDPQAPAGAVYRFPIVDGKPGARVLAAHFAPGDGPAGVALLDDGSMVVTLHDAGAVVLLDATGAEVRRVGGASAGAPIEAPIGLAFDRGTLLVTNQSSAKEHAAVLAVGIR